MWPRTEKSYQISVKKFWWKSPVTIETCLIDSNHKFNLHDKNFLIEKLSKYGFEVKNVDNSAIYKFICPKYFDVCYIDFYLVTLTNNHQIGIIEIVDLCVNERYRSKGIGSQFIKILDNIALEDSISFIVGELEDDEEGEPLEARKRFYIKNGFTVKPNEKSKISGFIVKKCIKGKL